MLKCFNAMMKHIVALSHFGIKAFKNSFILHSKFIHYIT